MKKMCFFNHRFHPSEITLRYLMGQAGEADFTDFVFDGKCGFLSLLKDSECANKLHTLTGYYIIKKLFPQADFRCNQFLSNATSPDFLLLKQQSVFSLRYSNFFSNSEYN